MDGYGQQGMPERTPTPQIWVRMHDGQKVLGRLRRRWQASDGQWFYEVSITLWAHANVGGRDVAEPADIVFSVPATHVAPVPEEAQAYKCVPVRRHPGVIARARTGRRPAAPSPPGPRATAASDETGVKWQRSSGGEVDRWKITYLRRPYNATGPRRSVLHHAACFIAADAAELTTDQAREALRRPGAEACGMCGANRLTAPPDAPGEAR